MLTRPTTLNHELVTGAEALLGLLLLALSAVMLFTLFTANPPAGL